MFPSLPILPPATPMLSAMYVRRFAADKPPPKSFYSHISDDSFLESEKLLELSAQTLIDVDLQIRATGSLISSLYEALAAPLFGESNGPESDSFFSDQIAADYMLLDSDLSFVPETEFDCLTVADSEDEGGVEACGGDPWTATAEPASVTAEEVAFYKNWRPLSPDVEEMIGLLCPAYLKLVRSFPISFIVIRIEIGFYGDCVVKMLWEFGLGRTEMMRYKLHTID